MTELSRLEDTVGKLNTTVHELTVTVATLAATLVQINVRDIEDRGMASKQDARLGTLEVWRGRITGQISLLYWLIGVGIGLTGAVVAHAFRWLP